MKNEKCAKEEPHSEFTKEEQEEFLNLLGRITPERSGCSTSFFFVNVCIIQVKTLESNPR